MPGLYGRERLRKGPSSEILDGFSGVSPLPADAAEIDPVKDHHQVRRLDFYALRRARRRCDREADRALLESLVPEGISIGVPIEGG
jgi:hypothetical protein